MSHLCTLAGLFQAAWQAEQAALQCHALHNTMQAKVFLYGFFPHRCPLPIMGSMVLLEPTRAFCPSCFSALPNAWDLLRVEIAQLV